MKKAIAEIKRFFSWLNKELKETGANAAHAIHR